MGGDCRAKAIEHVPRAVLIVSLVAMTFLVYISVFGDRVGYDVDPASWLPGIPEGDPNMGSVGVHQKWLPVNGEEDGRGLTLQIVDNLANGSDWDDYFRAYVEEWDNGTDAVTLNIRTTSYDPDCRGVLRAMKVCNGNYGPTEWNGVNLILVKDGYIISSIAKMNDYYLEGTNEAQRKFTMCHELGHGLGLGHSDENFQNTDTGNCMDYTNTPENNLHPDEYNFKILDELYGSAVGNGTVAESRSTRRMTDEEERAMEGQFDAYAACLSDPIEVSSKMIQHSRDSQSRDSPSESSDCGLWRLLDKTDTAEHHERILGNGYTIRTKLELHSDET
jgi:hypothetical protein